MIILALLLLTPLLGQPAFPAPDRLLALDAVEFALGNKPAFTTNSAQDTAAGHFFAESAHELFLRFVGS